MTTTLMRPAAAAAFSFVLLATGCTANRYKEAVHTFATTTVTVRAIVDQSDHQLAQDRIDNDVGTVLAQNVRLHFDSSQCEAMQTPEACSATAPSDATLTFRGEVPSAPIKMADALKRYGDALQGVVDADVSGDLAEKAQGLANSSKALVALLKISGAVPVVGAAQFVVTGLVGAYLESQRLNVLRSNVPLADPLVAQMTVKLEKLLDSRRKSAIENESQLMAADVILVNELPHSSRPADEAVRLAAIERIAQRSARLRSLTTTDEAVAVDQVKLAHAKLAEALKNPNVDLDELATELKKYADIAKNAYEAAHEKE